MTTFDHALLTRMIRAGQGLEPADLVVRDVRLLDVMTGAITPTDVAVVAGRIVGTHGNYEGNRIVDGRGRYCVPGFIDAHLHIESSLVTPFEFDRNVLPHGVTTAICDPHEIANVIGQAGIAYFTESALRTVMDIRVNLSSCVPATPFETSGATLELADLQPFSDHPKVIGLAEVMNFPGVLAGDPGMIAKLAAFQSGHIDGHAPLVSGLALNGYLAAGIRTDHEATTAAEAREKLAKGMSILIREGSVSKDLAALAEILDENTSSFVALCTDDRNPLDIHEGGHLDGMIRELIARGCPRHHVYRAASWSAARIFGLRDRGLVVRVIRTPALEHATHARHRRRVLLRAEPPAQEREHGLRARGPGLEGPPGRDDGRPQADRWKVAGQGARRRIDQSGGLMPDRPSAAPDRVRHRAPAHDATRG